jgi:hypothetical protein
MRPEQIAPDYQIERGGFRDELMKPEQIVFAPKCHLLPPEAGASEQGLFCED